MLNKLFNIGVLDHHLLLEKKQIRILNFIALFTILASVFIEIADLIVLPKNTVSYRHLISFLAILVSVATIYLQHVGKIMHARVFFFLLITCTLFSNANIALRGRYEEYEYLALPVLSILLFNKRVIHYGMLAISIAMFYLPNYYLGIYPDDSFGHISTLFVFLALFSFTLVFREVNEKNEDQLRTLNLQLEQSKKNELAFLQLKSLRSQMNSHFIFNSLNSIQDLVLKQDVDSAYDYITLFSRLVRDAMNYSNKDYILLEDELAFLDVYLKLETLRFGDDFEYEITHDEIEELRLPSLIIQPFVENALVHGLFHKSGKKKLSIHFAYNKTLSCTIVDNGVGRKKVAEIQNRQGNNIRESFALRAIDERLSILRGQNMSKVGYEITDLYDGSNPAGTMVEITLPSHSIF